jgi:drug/metabolite transporter (DMT)-like permease
VKYLIGIFLGLFGSSAAYALLKEFISGEGIRTGAIFLASVTIICIVVLYLLADHRLDWLFE